MQASVLEKSTQPRVTPERLVGMFNGFGPAFIIDAAARLGMFDAMAEGPRTAPEIARACSVSERGAKRVLDALVGLQFLRKTNAAYSLTEETATFLVRGKPSYFGGILRHTVDSIIPHWANLRQTVRTGRPAAPMNQEAVGAEYFAGFVADLFAPNFLPAQALARTLIAAHPEQPFKLLDLATGAGVWGIAAALSAPHVEVTAVDWKEVIPVARKTAAQFHVEQRIRFVEGDLLQVDFGSGYSAAVLGMVLHTNGPDWNRRLLARTYQALASGGTVAIAEWLVNDDRTGPVPALHFAVNMLVHLEEGDAYSFGEIEGWLRESGFKNVRTMEVGAPYPVILAEK